MKTRLYRLLRRRGFEGREDFGGQEGGEANGRRKNDAWKRKDIGNTGNTGYSLRSN